MVHRFVKKYYVNIYLLVNYLIINKNKNNEIKTEEPFPTIHTKNYIHGVRLSYRSA
jgi:hypothetical protein